MYLVNDIKWHRTPLLKFTPKIKASRYFSEERNVQKKCIDTLGVSAHPILFIYYLIFSPKEASQEAQKATNSKVPSPIYLEISTQKIGELLQNKQICAADIRCLDSDSKQCLMKLCLENCLIEK